MICLILLCRTIELTVFDALMSWSLSGWRGGLKRVVAVAVIRKFWSIGLEAPLRHSDRN